MIALAVGFLLSFVFNLLIIRYEHLHGHITADHDLGGVQKFHVRPVPRIGGIGIVVGALAGLLAKHFNESPEAANQGFLLIGASIPVFIAGLVEDITKKVGVKERLIAGIISALFAGYILSAWITRLDLPFIDSFLETPEITWGGGSFHLTGIFTLTLTALGVSGVANAFNIIDGYNGLASVVAIIILLGLAYVADQVGDRQIMICSLATIGALAGFAIWNYPNGYIFLGDGGAYFVGFTIAELSIMLVARNPQVSPWFPLVLSLYPIFETIFTIYRRTSVGRSPGLPDAAHLHQLVYRRLVRWAVGLDCEKRRNQRNSLTSPYLWFMSSVGVIPAMMYWAQTNALMVSAVVFVIFYVFCYMLIFRRKFPKWIQVRMKAKDKGKGTQN